MSWEAIGAVGEIASAMGVIASLIYLALQIRNQNSESKSRAISEISNQWNHILGDISINQELARSWKVGLNNFEELDEIQMVQFSTHLSRLFKTYEGFYEQWCTQKLNDETWAGLENSISDIIQYPGSKIWWSRRKHWYTPSFQSFIDGCIETEQPTNLYGEQDSQKVQNDT